MSGSPTGRPLLELLAVMDRLRSPGGCPWDAEQTHESLVTYLAEEAFEAIEAIESGDREAMREELGDLLLQVVFHARIGQEDPDRPWSIDDVAEGIRDKLVARHPHVFGAEVARSAAHVESVWQARKAVEKSRSSVLEGIPAALPALLLAAKMHTRAQHGGVTAATADPQVLAVARAALDGLGIRDASGSSVLGELLLALTVIGHEDGIDAEASLRAALRGYAQRIRSAEATPGPA